jgi:hypothetical protein
MKNLFVMPFFAQGKKFIVYKKSYFPPCWRPRQQG